MININKVIFNYLVRQSSKLQIYLIIFSISIVSILEVLGIGIIPAYLYYILNPDILKEKLPNIFSFILNFTEEKNLPFFIIIFLIFLYLIKNLIIFLIQLFQVRFWMNFRFNLNKDTFIYYLDLPLLKFSKINPSIMINNILVETAHASSYIRDGIILLNEILFLMLISFLIFYTQPLIINLSIVALILLSFVFYLLVKNIVKSKGDMGLYFRERYIKFLNQGFGLFKETKIYDKKDYVLNNFLENVREELRTSAFAKIISDIPKLLIEVFSVIFILGLCYFFLIENDFQIKSFLPTISLFVISFVRIIPSVNKIVVQLNRLKFFRTSTGKIETILVNDKIDKKKDDKDQIKQFEHIEFKNIEFDYIDTNKHAKKILNNLNLSIKRGQKIAIVGRTGSGKSTLLNLILGLLNLNNGRIIINKSFDLKDNINFWLSRVSLVPQDNYLFDASIKENITLQNLKSSIDKEKLDNACKIAQIDNFIQSLNNNYNSHVGERGVEISGGQKQRICIARALYHAKDILFFDEATSSLDISTEKKIIDKIVQIPELTFICITHRTSILDSFDKIYEIGDGYINEKK